MGRKTALLFLFAAFFLSLYLTRDGFRSTLSDIPDWTTAHALVSMRAYDDWGFFKLTGLSSFLPKTQELAGTDVTRHFFYISYPLSWLHLPYAVYRVANLLHVPIPLGPLYLRAFSLLFNRLLGVLAFFVFLEALGGAFGFRKKDSTAYALLGSLFWLFSTPSLFWTISAYFSDLNIAAPFCLLLAFLVKHEFGHKSLSKHASLLFGLLLFWCAATDWFLILTAFSAFLLFYYRAKARSAFKELLFSLFALLAAGIYFFYQLLIFGPRFDLLFARFEQRVFGIGSLPGNIPYGGNLFSQFLQIVFNPYGLLFSVFLLVLLGCAVFFVWWDKTKLLPPLSFFLFLLPVLHWFLLQEQSSHHEYSGFKFSFLFSVLVWGAIATAAKYFSERKPAVLALSLLLLLFWSYQGLSGFESFSSRFSDHHETEDRGRFFAELLDKEKIDLAVSDDFPIIATPPQALWPANRYIYYPYMLKAYFSQGLIRKDFQALTMIVGSTYPDWDKYREACKIVPYGRISLKLCRVEPKEMGLPGM